MKSATAPRRPRPTTAELRAQGRTTALSDAEAALIAAYIARVDDLPLADLDPTDLEDLVLPGLVDLEDNLRALHNLH